MWLELQKQLTHQNTSLNGGGSDSDTPWCTEFRLMTCGLLMGMLLATKATIAARRWRSVIAFHHAMPITSSAVARLVLLGAAAVRIGVTLSALMNSPECAGSRTAPSRLARGRSWFLGDFRIWRRRRCHGR